MLKAQNKQKRFKKNFFFKKIKIKKRYAGTKNYHNP